MSDKIKDNPALDLETRILNQLQNVMPAGQTIEQLKKYLRVGTDSEILRALHKAGEHNSVYEKQRTWYLNTKQ